MPAELAGDEPSVVYGEPSEETPPKPSNEPRAVLPAESDPPADVLIEEF